MTLTLRRLQAGHGHAEKMFLRNIWWPLYRNFDKLHPEYEVADFWKGSRFIDFAFIHPHFRIAIEIDGFGPHLRDVSRYQFADERRRHTFLTGMGWQVCRFAYEDIVENPNICKQLLQLVLGRYVGMNDYAHAIGIRDREILQFAFRKVSPITPGEVAVNFGVHTRTARRFLQRLTTKGLLVPTNPNQQRIRSYRLSDNVPYETLL